jgi:hydrogenase-1 operon protein HyaF
MVSSNGPDAGAAPAARVRALLAEIAQLVDGLARNGGDARVDLRSPPLGPGDYAALQDALGRGAVSARVDAASMTEVRETRYPGVWWVTHYNSAREIAADFIEVCVVPEILATPPEDIVRGLEELRSRTRAGGPWANRPTPG